MKRSELVAAIVEMYRTAVTHMPADVVKALQRGLRTETNLRARAVLKTMLKNIAMADAEVRPLCQDTGIPLFYVKYQSKKYKQLELKQIIKEATNLATKVVPLRANAYDIVRGKAIGNYPIIYFKETEDQSQIQFFLKSG